MRGFVLAGAAGLALIVGVASWHAGWGLAGTAASLVAFGLGAASAVSWSRRRALLRKGRARAEWGDHLGAARFFEEAGSKLAAARSYARAGSAVAAARLYVAVGRSEETPLAFASASRAEISSAAELLESAGALADLELAKAVSNALLRVGDRGRLTADLLQRMGNSPAAAEILAESGAVEMGAALLREAGDPAGAARLYFRHRAWAEARQAFLALGESREAAAAARELGDADAAAELFEKAGDPVEAARTFLGAGRPRDAAAVHRRAGSPAAAADILAGAGFVSDACDLLTESGDPDGAVELLVRLGRAKDAAEMLRSRGEARRAAVLLAKSGDRLHQAQLLEGEGDLVGAAQIYLDLGRPREARDILSEAPDLEGQGRFLYARALLAANEAEAAAAEFEQVAANPGTASQRDALYGQGRALEACSRLNEAAEAYGELARLDPNYRDAGYRLRSIRARLTDRSPRSSVDPTIIRPESSPLTPVLPAEWRGDETSSSLPAEKNDGVSPNGIPARYRVEREVGRGGMGVVYRAIDQTLGRAVAVKVLSQAFSQDARMKEMFVAEARAVAQLIHPNIVTLFDAGVEQDLPFLVFEFLEGPTLRSRIDGPLSASAAAAVLTGVADGLAYAHAQGIVHRDVKPENVVITLKGAAKLTDFGVAHIVGDRRGISGGAIMGTPHYMAPEQIAGGEIGSWTDVYALGAVFFECITARPVFPEGDPLFHNVYSPPPDPRTIVPAIPASAAELIAACLAKDAKARPGSAGEVANRLRELIHG
jgi:eukaryotic-like serine/threonine-protein kinase